MLLLLSFTAGICWYFKVTDGCVCPNSPQDFLWLVGQCCTSFAAGNRHKSFCKSFLQFSTRIFCFVKSNQFLFLFEEKLPDFHPSPHPHKRRNPEQWKQQPEWVQCCLCFLFCVLCCLLHTLPGFPKQCSLVVCNRCNAAWCECMTTATKQILMNKCESTVWKNIWDKI